MTERPTLGKWVFIFARRVGTTAVPPRTSKAITMVKAVFTSFSLHYLAIVKTEHDNIPAFVNNIN
jgi:hypothetical protein